MDKNHSEAPASVTYSLTSPKAFPILFTIRGDSGKDLLETMDIIEKVLEEKGYKPQEKRSFGGYQKKEEYVEGIKCPKDQGRIILKKSREGKPFHVCENGKFTNGVKSGCDFFKWVDEGPKDLF